MEFLLAIHCDHPQKKTVLRIDSNKTYGDLVTEIAKFLDIEPDILTQYDLLMVVLGQDVVSAKLNASDLIKDVITNQSTLLLGAPESVRPTQRKRVEEKETKESKEEKEETSLGPKNPLRGITCENVLTKWEDAKVDDEKDELERIMTFIDIYFDEFMQTAPEISPELMVDLVKRDTLSIPEVDLFNHVCVWGKARLKQKNKKEDPSNLKDELADILPSIRFARMSTRDIAVQVNKSKLLAPNQMVELYTYLGLKEAGKTPKLGKSIEQFEEKERTGRPMPGWFTFDGGLKHSMLQLENEGLTIKSTTTSYYQSVGGNVELQTGVHEYEVLIDQMYSHSYAIIIGYAQATWNQWGSSLMLGYSGHVQGWGYAVQHGQKYHNRQEVYAARCVQGDVVRVLLDLDNRTLEYFVNGKSQGVAYTDVEPPVRPCISMYGTNVVHVKFQKKKLQPLSKEKETSKEESKEESKE